MQVLQLQTGLTGKWGLQELLRRCRKNVLAAATTRMTAAHGRKSTTEPRRRREGAGAALAKPRTRSWFCLCDELMGMTDAGDCPAATAVAAEESGRSISFLSICKWHGWMGGP